MTPSLDRITLAAQLKLFEANHADLLGSLQQRETQLVAIQNEIQQYRGALSYSQHVQTQMKTAVAQALAAQEAARLATPPAELSTT